MKKVTSKDVATASGVSQSLVSLIINNVPDMKIKAETRQHVLDVAKQMSYRVNMNAKGMKSNKAAAIGLLSSWDTNSFVFPPVIKGVQSVCEENNISVVICTGRTNEEGVEDFVTYYQQNRIDGLIYISYVGVHYDGLMKNMLEHHIPFVCIIGARDLEGISCVDVNFCKSGYMAALHLIEKGYDKIGYFYPNKLETLNYAELERLQGCREAAKENGLDLIDLTLYDEFERLDEANKVKVADHFLSQNELGAVIGTSYACYILLKAAIRLGLNVPETLGVISLDNELYAPYLYPSLTTIDEPLAEMAKCATRLLFDKLNGSTLCIKMELMPTLTVRESTNRSYKQT